MRKYLYLYLLVVVATIADANAQEWMNFYSGAQAAYESNDLVTAEKQGQAALEQYLKENGSLSDNYGSILRLLQNITYSKGDVESALQFANKELQVRDEKKDVLYAGALSQQGIFLQTLGRYAEAQTSFNSAYDVLSQFYQSTDPQLIEAQLGQAINAYLADKPEEAFKIFTQVFAIPIQEVTPTYIQGEFYYATMLLDKKQFQQAFGYFLNVKDGYETMELTQTVEYASLLLDIGLCYHHLSDFASAEQLYGKASEIFGALKIADGDFLRLLSSRATNFESLGRPEEAQKLFATTETSGDASSLAVYLSNKAALSTNNGDYRQAGELYQQALSKLNKNSPAHSDLYVNILQNYAILYEDQGNYSEAKRLLSEAEMMAQTSDQFVAIQINRGDIYIKEGKLGEAKKFYNDALVSNPKLQSKDWARIVSGLGLIEYRYGDIQKADSIYALLLGKYSSGVITPDNTYAAALNNYAAIKQTNSEFFLARKLLVNAAEFTKAKYGVLNVSYAKALENLGYIDLDIGSLTSAKTEIDSAVLLNEKLLGPQSLAYGFTLMLQGIYHQHAGEYSAAEPVLKKAFKIVDESNDTSPSDWVRAANALSVFYQTMGNYDQAEGLFNQIMKKSESSLGVNSVEYSTALQNLATLYELQGKASEAMPLLEQSLEIDRKTYGENHPQYIVALRNLSVLYQKAGELAKAKVLLQSALTSTKTIFGENHPSYASSLANLAALYQDENNMTEAENAWKQSVAIRKSTLGEQHPDYSRSLHGLASVYFAQGKFEEAKQHYTAVIDQYLKQIDEYFPSLSEKEKGAFYQKIKPVFDSYQDFCIQYHKHNPTDGAILRDLYNIQLGTKAILLNSSNKVRQNILASGDTVLVNKFKKWLSAKENIVHYYSLSADEKKQYAGIATLEQRANDLEKELSLSSSLFKEEFGEEEYNTARITELLQEGEAATEILRINRKFVKDSVYYVGLTLTNKSDIPNLIIWPHGKRLENRLFRFHRNAIKYHYEDTISFNHYWAPLGPTLQGISKLYLSADGIFNKINFNILEDPKTHHSVIEDYTIHLLSNTKEIIEATERRSSPHYAVHLYGYADFHFKLDQDHSIVHGSNTLTRAFGFGEEIPLLPGTDKEVNNINDLFAQRNYQVATFKAGKASEANIKRTPHVKILHIATHGFFMNDLDINLSEGEGEDFFNNPLLRSGILLSGAGVGKNDAQLEGEDGILTAYEAMNIDLNETDLVVLSACETALGELRNGEGVYGLQRSFIVAGSSGVMMSLWQVDDAATQELMVNFYNLWLGGMSKHEAFRKAQLMIKEKYQSSFYWGAFILVGH